VVKQGGDVGYVVIFCGVCKGEGIIDVLWWW